MNCFQHTQKPAVGVCRNCGRGLCQDCATVAKGRLSCRGSCESEIARSERLQEQSEEALARHATLFQTSSGAYRRAFAISVFLGLFMLMIGWMSIAQRQSFVFGGFLIALGIVFVIYGLGHARAAQSYKQLANEKDAEITQT